MCRTMVGSIVYMTGGSGIITYDDAPYDLRGTKVSFIDKAC